MISTLIAKCFQLLGAHFNSELKTSSASTIRDSTTSLEPKVLCIYMLSYDTADALICEDEGIL